MNRTLKIYLLLIVLLFLPSTKSQCKKQFVYCFAPPLHWHKGMRIPKSYVSGRLEKLHKKFQGRAGAIAKAGGTTGNKQVAVILVKFPSWGSNTTKGSLTNPDFEGTDYTDIQSYFNNFVNYYNEASYSQLSLVVTYFWDGGSASTIPSTAVAYSANSSMATYGGNGDANVPTLIGEGIQSAGVTSSNYDFAVVIHAGYGNESSGASGDIWSMVASVSKNGFSKGAMVPAREISGGVHIPSTGVICHEFGHLLDLPDLYDTSTGSSRHVGKWDIMDAGTWAGSPSGSKPTHFSAWSKIQLGWISATDVQTSSTVTINNFKANDINSVYKVKILGNSTEYFLLSYRKQDGFDASLPGEGVLVWHVDDTVGSFSNNDVNANTTHPRLKIIEADNNGSIFNGTSEATDAYRTSSDIFPPATNDSANDSYDGTDSGITISNFSGVGGSNMSALVSFIAASSELTIKKAINYPNPIRGGTSTTIRMVFSRPISDGTLKIYTVSGELVFSYTLTSNDLKTDKSKDYEWIYEYIWDLKNSSGNNVASGIYLYVAEGNVGDSKQISIGKLAVIR